MKYILTDCDGVCLDWEEAFVIWMDHRGFKPVVEDYKHLYKINEWFGISREEGKRLVAPEVIVLVVAAAQFVD